MRTTRINWHRGRCPSRSNPRPVEAWRWRDAVPGPSDDWDESWDDDGYGEYWYSADEQEIVSAFCGEFRNSVPLPPGTRGKRSAAEPRGQGATVTEVEPDMDETWRLLTRSWHSVAGHRSALRRVLDHPYFQSVTSMQWNSWDMTLVEFLARTERLWLRSVAAWEPPGGSRSDALVDLVRHLLVRFDVPECLRIARGSEPSPHCVEQWGALPGTGDLPSLVGGWLCFIAAGRGWSMGKALRFAARVCGLVLGDTAVRFLWSAPTNLEFPAVLHWLSCRCAGLEAELATRIATSFSADHSELAASAADFFRRNPNAVARMPRIAAWANHEALEASRAGAKPFSFAGRSARRVLEEAELYWRRYMAPYPMQPEVAREWGIRGWSWADPVPGSDWQVLELHTSQQLDDESREQRHCVAGYAGCCASGSTVIVSVRKGVQRVLTVEVQVALKAVVQVRGFANRRPTAPEMELVRRWASAFGIAIQRA